MVLIGGLQSMWIAGYQVYGLSVLMKPIIAELGFSRTEASVPAGMARIEGGIEGPIAGWATDRYGPKWIILVGLIICGISLIMMYFVKSLVAFYIVWGFLLGSGHNLCSAIPVNTALSQWFIKKRGKALGVKYVFQGLSGVLTLPFLAFLITRVGWRVSCLIGGVVVLVVLLPVASLFLKSRRPEYYGLLPDGAAVEKTADTTQMIDRAAKYAAEVQEVDFTLKQALRTPSYWLLMLAFGGYGLVGAAIQVHLVPYLTDIGIDELRAAGMLSLMILCGLPMRFVSGFVQDSLAKNRQRFVLAGGYFLQVAGYAIFLLNQRSMLTVYIWLVLYGAGQGAGFVTEPLVARYYGRKAFGSIRGVQMAFAAIPGFIAPIFAGWIYDTTGNYQTAFITFGITLAIVALTMAFIVPPKPPVQVAEASKS